MKARPSRILKKLGVDELQLLTEELNLSGEEWKIHYLRFMPRNAPLRHGNSIYILAVSVSDQEILCDNRHKFKKTIALIAKLTGRPPGQLARSYWHKLLPGERIDVHRDVDHDNYNYFNRIVRYQIYTKFGRDFVIVIDGELWNYEADKELSACLIEFNHSGWHYYANHSAHEVVFLVMDFYKS